MRSIRLALGQFMGMQKLIGSIATLVILAALSWLYISVYGLPLRLDTRVQAALGQALAAEAGKLAAGSGRVILITRDTSHYKNPALDAQARSFQEDVAKNGLKVSTTHRLSVDPLRLTAVPPGDFQQILKKAAETDVIVSFLGPPVLDAGQLAGLGGQLPKVVAVCSGNLPRQVDLRHVFEQGILRV